MGEYTGAALVGAGAVVALELVVLHTGVFTRISYWVTMAIVAFFQVLVDGWLTKLSAPLVLYNPDELSGIRYPFDIPVEDYAFGFAMVTLAIVLWERGRQRAEPS